MNNKRKIGKIGEEFAVNFLIKNGITILKKNYFTKFGEIDLIGKQNETIIFIEVKSRNNLHFGLPKESVNKKKQDRIYDAANDFLSKNNLFYSKCRFDVISIFFKNSNSYAKIEWLKNQLFY